MAATLAGTLLFMGLVWPLLLVLLLGFERMRTRLRLLNPSAALPALAAAIVIAAGDARWEFSWMLFGATFAIDATGKGFLLLAALLWSASGLYAHSYFFGSDERVRFYRFFLLAMAGNFMLIAAQDLASFYVGFTLMSFASYVLVVFRKDAPALRAGLIYVTLVVIGEVLLFSALLMAAHAAGSVTFEAVQASIAAAPDRDLIMLLAFAGFGIKAGVVGMHVWLPLAHPVAPTPASAVLSGTMIKAGVLGWLRVFPLGTATLPEWGVALITLGLAGAFYGAGIGLTQRDPKTVLAYSSISQVGVITAAVGLGLLVPAVWPALLPGIVFYVLHHGLSKGALFLGASLCGSPERIQRRRIWLALWLPALAMAGAPWTSGMLAKHLIKAQTLHAPSPWDVVLPLLLTASAFATALLMVRLLYLLRPSAAPYGLAPTSGLVIPWAALLVVVVLLPWSLGHPFAYADGKAFAGVLWPLLLGIVISSAVVKTGVLRSIEPLPAGDVLVLLEQSLRPLRHLPRWLDDAGYRFNRMKERAGSEMTALRNSASGQIRRREYLIGYWGTAMLILLLLTLLTGFLASGGW